jgi:hypothetical protein
MIRSEQIVWYKAFLSDMWFGGDVRRRWEEGHHRGPKKKRRIKENKKAL